MPNDTDPTLPDSARKSPAEPGTAISTREAHAGREPEAAGAALLPPIESTLVGAGGDRPAAARRDEAGIAETGRSASDPLLLVTPVRADEPAGSPSDFEAAEELVGPESDVTDAGPAASAMPLPVDTPHAEDGHAREAATRIPRTEREERAPQPSAERVVEVRRGGFAPMVLGGIVAAGLGAGATWFALPNLPVGWQPAPAAPATPDGALLDEVRAAATAAAQAEVEALAAGIETRSLEAARQAAEAAAATAAPASLADDGALLAQAREAGADAARQLIAEAPASDAPAPAIASTLAAQADRLAALDRAVTELQARPAAQPAPDLGPIEGRVDELRARLDAQAADIEPLAQALDQLRAQLDTQAGEIAALGQRPSIDPATAQRLTELAADAAAAQDRIRVAADQADARLREAEAQAADLQAAAEEAARRARAAAAASALGEALQTGAPREAALAQLAEAGVQPPAALAAPVPTLDQLVAGFDPAARAAVRDALAAGAAEGSGSLIGNFLRAQTGARSVKPREGADADAVLSRAGDAVRRGEIRAALAELDALPEPARPAMADWTAQARAYVEAQSALAELTAPPDAASAEEPPASTGAADAQPAAAAGETAASPSAPELSAPAADAASTGTTDPGAAPAAPEAAAAAPDQPAAAPAATPSN